MVGDPNFLSRTTLRPRGPSVALTARLSFSTPRSRACRACSSNWSCLAGMVISFQREFFGDLSDGALGQDAEDIVLAQHLVGGAVDLDFGAAVLADEHAVADFDFEGLLLAFVIDLARADGDDFRLLGLFLGGVGNDDPAAFDFSLFERLHEHPVAERTE